MHFVIVHDCSHMTRKKETA